MYIPYVHLESAVPAHENSVLKEFFKSTVKPIRSFKLATEEVFIPWKLEMLQIRAFFFFRISGLAPNLWLYLPIVTMLNVKIKNFWKCFSLKNNGRLNRSQIFISSSSLNLLYYHMSGSLWKTQQYTHERIRPNKGLCLKMFDLVHLKGF